MIALDHSDTGIYRFSTFVRVRLGFCMTSPITTRRTVVRSVSDIYGTDASCLRLDSCEVRYMTLRDALVEVGRRHLTSRLLLEVVP